MCLQRPRKSCRGNCHLKGRNVLVGQTPLLWQLSHSSRSHCAHAWTLCRMSPLPCIMRWATANPEDCLVSSLLAIILENRTQHSCCYCPRKYDASECVRIFCPATMSSYNLFTAIAEKYLMR